MILMVYFLLCFWFRINAALPTDFFSNLGSFLDPPVLHRASQSSRLLRTTLQESIQVARRIHVRKIVAFEYFHTDEIQVSLENPILFDFSHHSGKIHFAFDRFVDTTPEHCTVNLYVTYRCRGQEMSRTLASDGRTNLNNASFESGEWCFHFSGVSTQFFESCIGNLEFTRSREGHLEFGFGLCVPPHDFEDTVIQTLTLTFFYCGNSAIFKVG